MPSPRSRNPSTEPRSKIGVIISDVNTKEWLGFLEFDPSGMIVISAFEGSGIHVNALKAYSDLLDQPLYVKHAGVLSQEGSISRVLLLKESHQLTELINLRSMPLGDHQILATGVESRR